MADHLAGIDDLRIESPTPKARRRRRLPLLLIAVLLVLAGGAGWLFRDHLGAAVPSVEVYTVPTDNPGGASGFSAAGYLEVIPPGPLVVSSMVEGRVQSIEVIEGQGVDEGQVLARLDDVLLRQEVRVRDAAAALAAAKLARMEAGFRVEEIEQAKADLERAQARLQQARADYERIEKLVGNGSVPKKSYDAALAGLKAAEAEVSASRAEFELRKQGYRKEDIAIARAELGAAEAELERARWKTTACVITAPKSGVVLERFIQPGNWVSLTASPSTQRERPSAIVSLFDPKRVQAWVDVNQRESGRVIVGQPAMLATDAQPGRPVRGRVVRILPKANLQKNTVRVNVEIPEVPDDLRPEMSVKVTFLAGDAGQKTSPGVVVPASAVLRDGSQAVVYAYVDGNARRREVEATDQSADRVTVLSGVRPGEQLILNPQGLTDGQAVQLKK